MKNTDWLAIYASILSTLIFCWNIIQSKPKIKVDIVFGIGAYGVEHISGAYVIVRNLSSVELPIGNVSLLFPAIQTTFKHWISHIWQFKRRPKNLGWCYSNLSNYLIDSGCPINLGPRQSHKIFIADPILEQIFAKATERSLIACVQDQLWNEFFSSPFHYPSSTQ